MMLLVLGSGGAGAPPGRAQNCYLLEASGARLLIDAGPGCGQRLIEHGYTVSDVDAVYISHRHIDHLAGLFDLSVHASAAGKPLPRILVAGSEAAGELVEVIRAHVVGSAASSLRVEEVGQGYQLGGGLLLSPVPSRHPVPCHGLLVRERGGATLYYSADTSLTFFVESSVAVADISLVEASLPPGMEEAAEKLGHMTTSQAAGLAAAAKPGSLVVLTHLTASSHRHALRERPPAGARARLAVAADGAAYTA